MSVTIQLRRDTAANWTTVNPVLFQGEFGIETDTLKVKVGDGSTDWVSLGYLSVGGGAVSSVNGHTGTVVLTSSDVGALPVSGGTMTGHLAPAVVALTFGSTISINAASGNVFAVTLTASTGTIANPANPVDGQTIRVRVIQDGTGSRTLAYGTAYDFGTSGAPVLSTAAGKVDILGFEYVASLSKWCYVGSGLGF